MHCVQVDECVVVQYARMVARDEAHAAHICRECVDMLDTACCLEALSPAPEVENLILVRIGRSEFWLLEVNAADPVSLLFEPGDEVVPDESTGSRDKRPLHNYPSCRRLGLSASASRGSQSLRFAMSAEIVFARVRRSGLSETDLTYSISRSVLSSIGRRPVSLLEAMAGLLRSWRGIGGLLTSVLATAAALPPELPICATASDLPRAAEPRRLRCLP